MKAILYRTLALLACIVAISCESNPTNPSDPGGGGGGGGGGTGAVAEVTDASFDDNTWDEVLDLGGAGGTGGAGHLTYLGQVGGDYRNIRLVVNGGGQLASFSIKRNWGYFPSSDGRIVSIDYSEDSILMSGGGNGQYSAPALRQNGKYYTLVPGGKAFTTPDLAWTRHTLTGLSQNDFRTLASASDHPDFSSSGGRIDVGFMRLHAVPGGGAQETKVGGIDNWRITIYR
jgi:hypothetical protein